MKEIRTHIGQKQQTAVRQVWVYCVREAEIQENLGQRVWLSEQVTVEKLNVELEVTWMTLVVVTS